MEKIRYELRKKTMDHASVRLRLKKIRYFVLGKEADKGLIFRIFIYLLLINTAYIYLKPVFYMISTMFKNTGDLLDPGVVWIPKTVYLGVLQDAYQLINYPITLSITAGMAGLVSILQVISCAVAGYAFARLQFPFKKLIMFFVILTFLIPPQLTVLPNLIAASQLGILKTTGFLRYLPIVLPALFGLGLKGALFVIIYRQFFSTLPKELEEAARIDGASVFKVFFRVMLPLAKPAMLVVFLFSFVWTWNDYYMPERFLFGIPDQPLSMAIRVLDTAIQARTATDGPSIFDDSLRLATGFLIILPPLVLYFFAQRWFVEGVERTGLVE